MCSFSVAIPQYQNPIDANKYTELCNNINNYIK